MIRITSLFPPLLSSLSAEKRSFPGKDLCQSTFFEDFHGDIPELLYDIPDPACRFIGTFIAPLIISMGCTGKKRNRAVKQSHYFGHTDVFRLADQVVSSPPSFPAMKNSLVPKLEENILQKFFWDPFL